MHAKRKAYNMAVKTEIICTLSLVRCMPAIINYICVCLPFENTFGPSLVVTKGAASGGLRGPPPIEMLPFAAQN